MTLTKKIDWEKCNGLVPAIIQDSATLEVLMLGFMNAEAVKLTQKTNRVHFWSRTKNRIWMKGEESGNVLNVESIELDCDSDSLLILARPAGNTCHSGTKSCFGKRVNFLAALEELIAERLKNPEDGSYISSLQKKGINKIAQKVGEEATEVVIAALAESDESLIGESADLVFHLLVLLDVRGLKFDDVIKKMQTRDKRKAVNSSSQAPCP